MNHYQKESFIGKKIIDVEYKVQNVLGPALLESVHEVCFCQYNLCDLVAELLQKKTLFYDVISQIDEISPEAFDLPKFQIHGNFFGK